MARVSRKNKFLAAIAGRVVVGLIKAVKKTSRPVYQPPTFFDDLRAEVPFIMAMWHGQFMMLADLNTREYKVAAMVARHGDGEIVAHFLRQFDISAIRGAGAGHRKRDRGGAYALRAAVRALEEGTIVAMTADVPPSRPRHAGNGIVTLARLSGRPIIPVAAATSRFIVLNTWSKMTINLPFSDLALVAGDPIFVAPDADDAELERKRREVENSLNAATSRAYEIAQATEPKLDTSTSQTTSSRNT
ncbi:lysophospholipid acyltransferase family protein [Hyphomicrobium sp. 99]|uniref:lysophospholipid acyltransferase family protein n=1 Tax=Hyphomicrobium sp. 99 TaxID=1163419 RepID=UPI0005F78BAE|nr:lysophospholipid acyltransferase family protein [Hyphomicrobium sp. 99]